MQTYREKLLNDISHLNEEQIRKFYQFFQVVKKEFFIKEKKNWKDDFKNISVWNETELNNVAQGIKNWEIPKY
ncbi:MAG: hypothetical protein SCALA702_00980 [Melioribacteraceae bacterium]|nr:MAG: hypothetical protein SCALA702_00980 [Melioribacteraceae bacterium]